MSSLSNSAKQAYLLSTCHKFANKTFTRLIKKHEIAKTACAKYQFDIWVTLDIPKPSTPQEAPESVKSEFKIVNIYNNFLNQRVSYDNTILEELNTLTNAEKLKIKQNYNLLIGSNIESNDIYSETQLYTLINLIRMYKGKYQYIFIPFTLDYSQDIGLVHQCALLIDLVNHKFIFYEPYGTYIKYEHNYAKPIEKYLQIYDDCLDTPYTFSTFHEYLIPEFASNGIQNIILNSNNAKAEVFNKNVENLLEEIKSTDISLYEQIMQDIEEDENPVNKTDKTITILNILDIFEKYTSGVENEAKSKQWIKALELYSLYNSKTCVSITIVEMDALFSGKNLLDMYNSYKNALYPNEILMKQITELLEEFYDHDLKKIEPTEKSRTICSYIA